MPKIKKKKKIKTPRQLFVIELDRLAGLIVRGRGKCARCGKETSLQDSHAFERTSEIVRWDLENHICLCAGCHLWWWHKEPLEAADWAKEYMGVPTIERLHKLVKENRGYKHSLYELGEIYEYLRSEYDKICI